MSTLFRTPGRRWGNLVGTLLVPAALVLAGCGGAPPSISQAANPLGSQSAIEAGTSAAGAVETSASATMAAATTDAISSALPVESSRTGSVTTAAPQSAVTTRAGTTTGAAARTTAAAKPGASGAPVAPGGFGNVDACKLVTKAEASALLGSPAVVSGVLDSVSDGSFSQSCMYSVGGGAVGSALGSLGAGATSAGAEKSGTIMVQLYPASGANWFKRDQNNGTKVETGIGDQYFLKGVGRAGSTQSGGISVLKGDTAVGIGVLTDSSKALSADQYREIGRNVVTRLPEQVSGPAPALPQFVPGTPTAVSPTPAPIAALPEAPTPSPAVKTVTASIQAALKAAQAGDLAKARAAYAPVGGQWAAIPNDGKLATPELYGGVADAIKQVGTVLASPDTDAAAAASALSDLADGIDAALATAQSQALAGALAPGLAAFATAGAGIPTPIAETSDKNAACVLLTTAEADAVLGGSAEVQALPSFDSTQRSCRFALHSVATAGSAATSATTTNSLRCTTATNGDTSCVGLADSVDLSKLGLISVELHLTGGARWYAENEQRLTGGGYRSGADIGDQFFAMGAQEIWVLKGDQALSITTLPSADFPGTPIEALKSLAKAAAGRMH